MIQFGRNQNQITHAFRHTVQANLERYSVRQAIVEYLVQLEYSLPQAPFAGEVAVKGVHLEFRAYKFIDGTINVGRITLCK